MLVEYKCLWCNYKIETFPAATVSHWCKPRQDQENLWDPDEWRKRLNKLEKRHNGEVGR